MAQYREGKTRAEKFNDFLVGFMEGRNKRDEHALKRQELAIKAQGESGMNIKDLLSTAVSAKALEEWNPQYRGLTQAVFQAGMAQGRGGQPPQQMPQAQPVAPNQPVGNMQPMQPVMTVNGQTMPAGQLNPEQLQAQVARYNLSPNRAQDTMQNIAQKQVEGQLEQQQKSAQSKVTAGYNLDMVSQALLPLSRTLADSYREGGSGNALKAMITGLAQEGLLPEGQQEKLSDSTAVEGKRTEVLLKMMPLMSSQYGKEGSTRIIKSVFDKLSQTLPSSKNAPLNAIKMIDNSVDTLISVVRAVNNVNLADYDISDPQQEKALIDKITLLAANIEMSGEEKQVIDNFKSTITKPIQEYIVERELKKRGVL